MKALLVEDNPVDADLIRRSFARSTLDCKLTWARSLAEAIDQLRKHVRCDPHGPHAAGC